MEPSVGVSIDVDQHLQGDEKAVTSRTEKSTASSKSVHANVYT